MRWSPDGDGNHRANPFSVGTPASTSTVKDRPQAGQVGVCGGVESEGGRDADRVEGAPRVVAATGMVEAVAGGAEAEAVDADETTGFIDLGAAPRRELSDDRIGLVTDAEEVSDG